VLLRGSCAAKQQQCPRYGGRALVNLLPTDRVHGGNSAAFGTLWLE